ncbi:MAG: hypothetical protein V2A64_02935 [Candidatus Omnitrophota bacterium]
MKQIICNHLSIGRYIKLFLLLLLVFCFFRPVFAQEKLSIEDIVISSTFKSLAKGFILVSNINSLKKNNIARLNKMDGKKFNKQYAKVYNTLKDLPVRLKAAYKITEHMTKEEAVKNIESMDKKKMSKIIDSIPDKVIVSNFKRYISETKQKIQQNNIIEQIDNLWNKVIKQSGGE